MAWDDGFNIPVINFLVEFLNAPPKNAKTAHAEIKAAVLPFVEPKPDEDLERHLKKLVDKFNEINAKPRWYVREIQFAPDVVKPVLPSSDLWLQQKMVSQTVEHEMLLALATLLERGEIIAIRRCPHCQKFFRRPDRRAAYCSEQCRFEYNNRTRPEGYFADIQWERRHGRRLTKTEKRARQRVRQKRKEGRQQR